MSSRRQSEYWSWEIAIPESPDYSAVGLCHGSLLTNGSVRAVCPNHDGDATYEVLYQLEDWPLADMLFDFVESDFESVFILQEVWPSPKDETMQSKREWESLRCYSSAVRNNLAGDLVSDIRHFTLLTNASFDAHMPLLQDPDDISNTLRQVLQVEDVDFILFCGPNGADRVITTHRVVSGLWKLQHTMSPLRLTWSEFASGNTIDY